MSQDDPLDDPIEDPFDFESTESSSAEQVDFDVTNAESRLAIEPPEAKLDVDVPSADGAPAELQRTFWGIVILVKIGMMAGSVGALLLLLTPLRDIGAAALLIGLFALGHAYWKYRQYNAD